VLGEGGIGAKTSLLMRFLSGTFVPELEPTIGDSIRKYVDVSGGSYLLDIMDTPGQDEYGCLRDHFSRCAHGVMLGFCVTSRASVTSVVRVLFRSLLKVKDGVRPPMILIGNKIDLKDDIQVSSKCGEFVGRILVPLH